LRQILDANRHFLHVHEILDERMNFSTLPSFAKRSKRQGLAKKCSASERLN